MQLHCVQQENSHFVVYIVKEHAHFLTNSLTLHDAILRDMAFYSS